MKIAIVTAGAAGMYCGNCLRDNTLARSLTALGHEVLLIPTYTPTRTDEPNVSQPRVFLGGINVYLQQKSAFFRHTPWFADRWLDAPWLLNWASGLAIKTEAAELGALTASMLQGEQGPNHKEFVKLAAWLADDVRPDVVDISNALLLGLAPSLRRLLRVPIVCSLAGEDLFLDGLPEPWHSQSVALLRQRVQDVDAFVTFSHYYASHMLDYLQIPQPKMYQVPLGISLDGYGEGPGALNSAATEGEKTGRFVVGYLSRICPEKGLHLLCEAFRLLRGQDRYAECRLRVAGYLGNRDRAYWEGLERQIQDWGLSESVEYAGEPNRQGKIRFLQSLDVFSVPSVCRESKGLPVLEAMANRVPVVQPWHGIYTELVNATQGGVLVPPSDPKALADAIAQLFDNKPYCQEIGRRGRLAVERNFTAQRMAEATLGVYRHCMGKEKENPRPPR